MPYGAANWVDTHDVLAMAYDTIIPGYGTQATNTLRLWSARATEEIDLSAFNRGNYMHAVESKNHSENVSRVLYPDDTTPSGRELRLQQEYFFVSAQRAGPRCAATCATTPASTTCPTRSASTSTTPTRRWPSPS